MGSDYFEVEWMANDYSAGSTRGFYFRKPRKDLKLIGQSLRDIENKLPLMRSPINPSRMVFGGVQQHAPEHQNSGAFT